MPKLTVTTRSGEGREIAVATGPSLMQGLREAGVDEIQAVCGGCAACCTCHVYVASEQLDRLPPMSEEEDALLESSDARQPTSRLSCQIPVTEALEGLRVTVAPDL